MELYDRVRRACHVDGMSRREASRLFGIDRKTVSKILRHSVPPRYRRSKSPARPKLGPFVPIIDQILEDDKSKLKKQRHTAKRIHARLRDEHGFTGGKRWSRDFGPVDKVDRMMKVTIRNEEPKEPFVSQPGSRSAV